MSAGNVVLIGLGMVARMHVAAIKDAGLQLYGVLGRDQAKAQAFGAEVGAARVFGSLDEVLADEAVGFVILATPPDARLEMIQALATAGIAVLSEKPLERNYQRAAHLVEVCDAAAVPFGVMLQHRMRPAAQALLARVQAGDLGEIGSVELRVPWWRDQTYYDAPGRGTYARDGGGVLITQAIHAIDMMLQLCGPVAEVQGLIATTPLHRLEAEDFASASLRFRSGAVGSLMATTTQFPGESEEITLNGVKGSATLSAGALRYTFRDGRVEQDGGSGGSGGGADPMAFTHDWHQAVIEDFAQAVAQERAPLVSARSALPAQRLIDAISRAARMGVRLSLPEEQDGGC